MLGGLVPPIGPPLEHVTCGKGMRGSIQNGILETFFASQHDVKRDLYMFELRGALLDGAGACTYKSLQVNRHMEVSVHLARTKFLTIGVVCGHDVPDGCVKLREVCAAFVAHY